MRQLIRCALVMASVIAVIVVLLGGAGIYIVVNLDDFRDDISTAMTELLQRPAKIGAVSVNWDGAVPLVGITDLTILDENGAPAAGFRTAHLRVDVMASLREVGLRASQMRITGAEVGVARDAAGGVRIMGLGTSAQAQDAPLTTRRLLLGPGSVEFSDAKLMIRDVRFGDKPLTLGLRIQIQREGLSQRIHGEIQLPDSRDSIAISGQLGIDESSSNWLANLHVGGRDIRLAPLARLMPGATLPGANARLDLSAKLRFTNGVLTRATGRVNLNTLDLLPDDPLPGPAELGGAFEYSPVEDGWLLQVSGLGVTGALQKWRAKNARLRYRVGTQGAPGRYTAKLSSAQVEDVLALIAYLEPGTEDIDEIRQYRVQGNATEVSAAWLDVGTGDAPFAAAFTFDSLAWPERVGENWGLTGIAGFASITPQGGIINLASDAPVHISASDVFTRPLRFDTFTGTLSLDRTDGRIAVRSEGVDARGPELNARVSGDITSDAAPSLALDISIKIPRLTPKQMQALLPSPIFPSQFNRWLNAAVKSGTVEQTNILLKGRATELTVAPDNDSVVVRGLMQKIKLDFAPGWPAFEALTGPFEVKRGRLNIEPASARLYATDIAVNARIDNLAKPQPAMALALKSRGSVKDLLKLLLSSPIAGQLPDAVKRMSASGQATVDSQMMLSSDPKLARARTTIRLKGASIKLADELPTVQALNGQLSLSGKTLVAKNLSGKWLDQAVELDLNASATGTGKLAIRSAVSSQTLQRLAAVGDVEAPRWIRAVKGASPWSVEIQGGSGGKVQFSANTNLSGTAIDLPPPLGKSRQSARALSLSGDIAQDKSRIRATYGPIALATVVHLQRDGAVGYEVGFNTDVPGAQLGRRRIGGHLPLLDLDAWSAFLDPDSSTSRINMPRVDVTLDSLRFAGVSFPITRVTVPRPDTGKAVTVNIDGPNLAGRVEPPTDSAPLRIDLDRLVVPQFDVFEDARTDPRQVPAFTFSAKHLVYGKVDLGTLKVSAKSNPDGLDFDTLYLLSPLFDLEGDGAWRVRTASQRSSFSLRIFANELPKLLIAAGIDAKLAQGGPTQIEAKVAWPGTPGDVTVKSLEGELSFNVGSGRLLDIDAGASAKLFGLLNLRSLPQILSLDLGGVFEKGLEFSRIAGDITLDGGNAYTNSVTLNSRPATITIAGRTGLLDEDYDQIVTVQPKLSDSLPVAGAAFGGVGAGVGAALWLAEKLLNTKLVDEAASFKYTVTGPWSDPQVVRTRQAETESEDR